jgi:hypothetical protein
MRCPVGSLALVLFLLATASQPARAQSGGGPIDLQLFHPAMDTRGLISLDGSETIGHLRMDFKVGVNYAYRPFSVMGPTVGGTWCQGGGTCGVGDAQYLSSRYRVEHLGTGELIVALGLSRYFQLGLGLPLSFWTGYTQPQAQVLPDQDRTAVGAFGLGDLALHLKGMILNQSRFPVGLAAKATVGFPTAAAGEFLGSERFRVTLGVVLDRSLLKGRLKLALNVGTHLRFGADRAWTDSRLCAQGDQLLDCGTGRTLRSGHGLYYGLGLSFGIVRDRFDVLAELYGQTPFSGLFDLAPEGPLGSAHEAALGFRLRIGKIAAFEFGCAFGLTRREDNGQYGAALFRPYFGLQVQTELVTVKALALKAAEWEPVKRALAGFRELAEARLESLLAGIQAAAMELTRKLADQALGLAMKVVMGDDVQAFVKQLVGAYSRWQAIQDQLLVVYTASGIALKDARARLKTLLEQTQSITADLKVLLRERLEQRIQESIRPRFESLLGSQWDQVVAPLLDKVVGALTTLAGTIPGAGGVLSTTVNLLVAKAKAELKTWAQGKATALLDQLVKSTLDRIFSMVFAPGGRIEGALDWLNTHLQALQKAVDQAGAELEAKRQLIEKMLR